MRVAVGGFHLDHTVADLKQADIESPTAQVEDKDGFIFLLVESVGERGSGRLVDDAQDFEARDLAGVLGRLPLGIVEISRDGDHCAGDAFTQVRLGIGLQLRQHHCRDLLRCVLPIVHRDLDAHVVAASLDGFEGDHFSLFLDLVPAASHEALDRIHCVFGVDDCLALGCLAYQPFSTLCEGHDRRNQPSPFRSGDNDRVTGFHHRYYAVGRT